ncbi:Vacuolar protein sorting-associated protein 54 [Cytospora mali]|uniref:Vacuolar protein sorting-associated protein 54 n=1 Tax=Cytospora mali TaxID=578113 RepID=A0A194W4G1_CYTMA|nr:Vacuolar protein sorting-associated protein 54 [Valsa mali]
MYSNSGARKSVDSLASPTSPQSVRSEFPFHTARHGSVSTRRGSAASSIHSVGGALDQGSWGGAVLEIGQNAISTLLQPPIVRTGLLPHTTAPASSAHKPPTARDIPPVTLTTIQKVNPAEFEPYLKQVGALYRQLQKVKESEEEDIIHRNRGRGDEELGEPFEPNRLQPSRRAPNSRRASVSSISSWTNIEAPSPVRRSSSNYTRKIAQGPPPLSTIPVVYFEEDFHLENPRTFDVVSERSEVIRQEEKGSNGNGTVPRKALATNAILQEKLSWYMDTVEMHLISSISTASTTFFSALGSLKELHTEAAESVERIKTLRQELEGLDEEIVISGLNTIQQRRRRENVQQLHHAVLQLKEVVSQLANCESLVDSGDVDAALDSIDSLERLIAGEDDEFRPPAPALRDVQLRDLRGATALQGVNDDMNILRSRIGKAYETKFVASLMTDLKRHVEEVSTREVLMRWSSASVRARGGRARDPSAFPSYFSSTDVLRAQLIESLAGLYRAKQITVAVTAYRESVIKEIRNLVKQGLPSSNDDDNMSVMSASTATGGRKLSQREKSSILARNLRALDPADAEELLVKIYVSVTEILRRASTQVKLMLDVAASIEDGSIPSGLKSPPLKSPPMSPSVRRTSVAGLEAQEEIHKVLDLAALLGNAVDIAQDKIVRVLRVRSEQSTHLDLVWFLRYFTLNLHFANECESISGRSGTQLKDEVNDHIKKFVQNHGDSEQQKLAQGMESDQWGAIDFSEKHNAQLQRIMQCSTSDPPDWAVGTQIWVPHPDDEVNGNEKTAQNNGAGKSKAFIDSESFVLPNSAIYCLEGMENFLHLVVGIPSITSDVAKSLMQYLRAFDSRCKQLILGAGATKSAGLKNITTRHLASSSQALGFVAALIPYVREFIRRHAGSGAAAGLMTDFDKVKRDYQEHMQTIYDKLVEIMSGRAGTHARTARAIEWHTDLKSPHPYMEILVKESSLLHRNLVKHLSEDTVRMIMIPVFSSFKEQFGPAFQEADPVTEAGRDSMLRDLETFKAKLGHIDGFGDTSDYLANIVKSKQVKSASPPPSETKGEDEKKEVGAEKGEEANDGAEK